MDKLLQPVKIVCLVVFLAPTGLHCQRSQIPAINSASTILLKLIEMMVKYYGNKTQNCHLIVHAMSQMFTPDACL